MKKAKSSQVIPVIAVISLLALFTWQMGVFNMGMASVTMTGFSKIKPQLAATGLSADGTLDVIMTNGVGARIEVGTPKFIDSFTGQNIVCYGSPDNQIVKAGDNFRVIAKGCMKGYPGDVYSIQAQIPYTVTVGGVNTSHTEVGILRGPIDEAYSGGAYRSTYQSYGNISYGIHRSFDFGDWWTIVILLSILFLMSAHRGIKKISDSNRVQVIGVYAFIFLICANLIFIFGVDFALNASGSDGAAFRIRYGWLIESVIYLFVSGVLLIAGEYFVRQEEGRKSMISAILNPIFELLILCLAFIYPWRIASHFFRYRVYPQPTDLLWVLEIFIFAIMVVAYRLITYYLCRGRRGYLRPAIIGWFKTFANIFLVGAVLSFMYGVNKLIYSLGELELSFLIMSFLMFIAGATLMVLHRDNEVDPEDGQMQAPAKKSSGIFPLMVAVIILILFLWQFGVFGRNFESVILLLLGCAAGYLFFRGSKKD